MASQALAARVARLEAELRQLRAEVTGGGHSRRNWRRAVERFTDDEDVLAVLREAMKLREADRQRAHRKRARPRRASQ